MAGPRRATNFLFDDAIYAFSTPGLGRWYLATVHTTPGTTSKPGVVRTTWVGERPPWPEFRREVDDELAVVWPQDTFHLGPFGTVEQANDWLAKTPDPATA